MQQIQSFKGDEDEVDQEDEDDYDKSDLPTSARQHESPCVNDSICLPSNQQ